MKKLNFIAPIIALTLMSFGCSKSNQDETRDAEGKAPFPSEVLSLESWEITLGDGVVVDTLKEFSDEQFFYTANDGTDWVVFKAPNSGITTAHSHNTRSELKQNEIRDGEENIRWYPRDGGRLTGTLKVMNVSTSGDARVPASYSVVVGQIHSDDGHANEPCKIFYKKFPGHSVGSVFWNYEINTEGDNSGRWDYATPVWGYDWSTLGSDHDVYPEEPEDGIALGEEFSYEINVHQGVMYLTFTSEGHETMTFSKSMIESEYISREHLPDQIENLFVPIGRDGTEQADAYAGEIMFFAQGAYNQANGGDPESNMVWSTGSETYEGDVEMQYANGSYAEVWFRESSVEPGVDPDANQDLN
jgi:hypothetical protein